MGTMTAAETRTVRVDQKTHQQIREIAETAHLSMVDVISAAIERYRRELFFDQLNAACAQLTPDERQEERAEARAWDVTLADGRE